MHFAHPTTRRGMGSSVSPPEDSVFREGFIWRLPEGTVFWGRLSGGLPPEDSVFREGIILWGSRKTLSSGRISIGPQRLPEDSVFRERLSDRAPELQQASPRSGCAARKVVGGPKDSIKLVRLPEP